MRIVCSKYSDLDELVIQKASSLNLPLTGGTALEVWADYFNRTDVRKRSDNDIDIIRLRDYESLEFQKWIKSDIDFTKVKVDFAPASPSKRLTDKFVTTVNGVVIMTLPYIAWAKIVREDRSVKDFTDLKWIFSITQISDDEFSEAFNILGLTDEQIDYLNKVLSE